MEYIGFLIDFILHVDAHLTLFVQNYGAWVYALLFLILFVETGVVVMPFLPGDSLLFIVGALAGAGHIHLPLVMTVMFAGAFLGDQCNYMIGRALGPRVFGWQNSRFFNRSAFDAAHLFYKKHGGLTVILARFMPFIRTFAPFVAGVAHMDHSRFIFFNLIGAVLWVVSITLVGYFFGNIGFIARNLDKIIWIMILLPGVLAIVGGWRARRQARSTVSVSRAP